MMLEKALERPLDCKKIQPVYPKGNQSWIFIGRTDAEAEAAILWPPDAKYWLTGKDSNAGKDCTQEKGMIEDEMVGWNHWLNGHKFEQALRVGDGQGSLVCWRPWGCKESDTTVTELNWTLSTFAPLLHWILLCSSLFMSMHDLQLKTSLILLFKDKLLSKISILLQVMDIWASPVAQMVKIVPTMQETQFNLWVRKTPLEKQSTPLFLPVEKPMDRGAWWATVHGVGKSQTRLSD